ncbi:MAG: hypothetical protein ACRC67_44115 [Inquilinus sp.]
MSLWALAEYAAWAVSAVILLWMLADMLRIDRSYDEELLTSSREGELE